MQHTVYLGLGSNIGDRFGYLTRAVAELAKLMTVEKVSSVYETEPVGMEGTENFFNIVLEGTTELSPVALLGAVQETEGRLGRRSRTHRQPREIDIDLLLYNESIRNGEMLTLPHPELHRRRFVLVPLAEIAADAIHPVFKVSIATLLQRCPDTHLVRKTDKRMIVPQSK